MPSPIYNLAYTHSRARSAALTLEFFLLNSLSLIFPPASRKSRVPNRALIRGIREDLLGILREDCERIDRGIYPLSVLRPESPFEHFARYPKLVRDAVSIYFRRIQGRTTEFDSRAKALLADLPRYYRRNFHFQTNGYLSETSAEMYEHQVELLFKGAADPMRRLIIEPMYEHFMSSTKPSDGSGLRILEIGAGTGRATRFVRMAFPKAEIVAVDLSHPYLKVAKRKLADLGQVQLEQADGAHLPFKNAEFDAVYSVFLFHELPLAARREIIDESMRVLKPGGFLGLVDSVQTGDKKLLDPVLQAFPEEFHEPFYRNYIAHPMEDILKAAGLRDIRKETGFTSKLCWGSKKRAARPAAKLKDKSKTKRGPRKARSS